MIINSKNIAKCADAELRAVLQKLQKYEKYCKLLDGDIGTYVKTFDEIGKMPNQLKEWLKVFDGGLLFTTSMFSTRNQAAGKFNRLLSFSEVNSPEFKKENNIPQAIMSFAMTNYGNYYCYVADEGGSCVYEWDADQNALTVKWDSFAQWLEEQIDFAQSLIEDELLDPVED